jgi:hypothetical protein
MVVLVLRHPDAVARSLQRRNDHPPTEGLAIWERLMTAAISAAAGSPTVVTRFEDLLEDPARWAAETRTALRALGIPLDEHASADASAASVTSPATTTTPAPVASAEQRSLWRLVDSWHGTHDRFEPDPLPSPGGATIARFDQMCAEWLTTRRRGSAVRDRYAVPA